MDIKIYIQNQIKNFDRTTSNKQLMANLNAIYAVLENQGFLRSEISQVIEEVIKENIHESCLQLQIEILK